MLEFKHTMRALSPLFTGAGNSLGIKSELRKQKVKIANPVKITSNFTNNNDRELAFIDILNILYAQISPEYRLKRGTEIWKEFKNGLKACAGSKSISYFVSRYGERFDVGHFDTILVKYLKLFNDDEFLQYLTDNIDYLITMMRFNREHSKKDYKRINEIGKELEKLLDYLDKHKSDMFFDDTEMKKQMDCLFKEQKELELNKSGFNFDVDNYQISESTLTYSKDFENVPLFSGNSIAGMMRRLAMEDYLKYLGIGTVYDFTYHTFMTGGSLVDKVNDELTAKLEKFIFNMKDKLNIAVKGNTNLAGTSGEIDIENSDKLALYCPPLRLFGTATKGGMIESEMIVNNARLICKENGNGDTTLWSLINDIFYTKSDSEKLERNIEILEVTDTTNQMKYIMETLIEGIEFEHSFVLKTDNEFITNCFHATIKLWVEYHRIGGKSARGLGNLDLSDLEKQIDYERVKKYYEHLENYKTEIKEFLGV